MDKEEFKFLDKTIELEKREELDSSYKIRSYNDKLRLMESKKIPQKPIEDVLNDLLLKNSYISKKTKDSISKIIYSSKDRIIVVTTHLGQDIIWNRGKLIYSYGWFFFVSKPKSKQKSSKVNKAKKKKEPKKEEKTLSREDYSFEDLIIPLKEKENMRSLYNTKEYLQYLKLIKSRNIPQMPIKDVLHDLLVENQDVPMKEKKSIGKIIFYKKERVIVVKSLIGDKMYENLKSLVKKYGWYFYITGVPVGASQISVAIDKIERRFDENYFKNISISRENKDEKIRVTIYPIVLKPNHNCHILGLGNLNILLDCGISDSKIKEEKEGTEDKEEEVEKGDKVDKEEAEGGDVKETYEKPDDSIYIEEYLENLPKLILAEEKRQIEKEDIEKELASKNIQRQISLIPKIDAIFVSHSHYDHISGLKKLIQLNPEVPVLCSRITLDLFLLRDSNIEKLLKMLFM
jgi:hypothetical protein